MKSLQERLAPDNQCFGCGPANAEGLQIRSFVEGEELIAHWTPQRHHLAFGKVLNGGICGTLLDCHSNWCAAYFLMKASGSDELPCTVTAKYSISLRRPTPLDETLTLRARGVELEGDRATIEAFIEAEGEVTATCKGVFVAVKEGHPAFHRW